MTDRLLFTFNDKWALGYDSQQWMIMRRVRRRNPRGRSNWNPVRFIGSYKRILLLTMREKGIEPTPSAQRELDALPDSFRAWFKRFSEKEAPALRVEPQRPQEVKFLTPKPPQNDTGEAAA